VPAAQWRHPAELGPEWNWHEGDILLGTWADRHFGSRDDRHLVTIAGSRGGKSATILKPNLVNYTGSVLVIDPKGELARDTAEYRRVHLGQEVFVLDPFGVSGQPSSSFNPLTELAKESANVAADALLMAAAFIISNTKETFWTDAARNLVRGLLLFLIHKFGAKASLKMLREYLSADAATLKATLTEMAQTSSDVFDGIIRNTGTSFLGKLEIAEREFQSILSVAQEQTAPLDDLLKISGSSDFAMSDLKEQSITIYLVLPGMRMATHFRWLRMLLELALAAMERTPSRKDAVPVLFILEEFAALQRMESMESAIGFIAGYGVKLWTILQDLSQLKSHYPGSWETFIGNAGLIQAFSNVDVTTTEHLSKMLGKTRVADAKNTFASTNARGGGHSGVDEVIQLVSLLDPDEIARYFARETNRQLIISAGARPTFFMRPPIEGAKS
jgi:type IV secretion system protein VirD4